MIGSLVLLLVMAVAAPALHAQEGIDPPSGAFVRSCLVVEEYLPESGALVKTTVFDENARPGPGKRLVLYVEANVSTYLFMAAFNDMDRQLTNGWRPQFLAANAWQEYRLPLLPTTWEWKSADDAFEVDLALIEATQEGVDEIKMLISAMQDPDAEEKMLKLQTEEGGGGDRHQRLSTLARARGRRLRRSACGGYVAKTRVHGSDRGV